MKPLNQVANDRTTASKSPELSDDRVDTIANLESIDVASIPDSAKSGRPGFTTRMLRRGVLKKFSQLTDGLLLLTEGDTEHRFGNGTGDNSVTARMQIHSPEFFRRVAFGGSLGFAESYIFGEWTSDNPTNVVRIFCRNLDVTDSGNRGIVRLVTRLARKWHERQNNSKDGSARNIHAHYDLGNDFYSLFLDETLTYSSGVFETPESTLYEAQVAKIDRLCRKLDLKQSDHLVEIGTGWGGMAIHAAKNYGCRVTTTTISKEQHDFACRRVAEEGLADRVTLLLEDYRDLNGLFDKLVSVEMIEAVDYEYFDTFFTKCGNLLKPEGQMAIQGITMTEQRYPNYLKSVDFIQRYIFPGGCLITPKSVLDSVARTTDMRLLNVEDLAPHYGQTVRLWRERFFEQIEQVRLQGFPETFIRLWDFYLSYCEAAFEERLVGTVQMQFAKPRCTSDALRPFV
ncbi:MAG: cyclopropane-fatty-acyl-phospholipid synthase [Planctomycetaceae bacterium]|jgi:cyclopropane-fatty-acyl-phospholipid synthase